MAILQNIQYFVVFGSLRYKWQHRPCLSFVSQPLIALHSAHPIFYSICQPLTCIQCPTIAIILSSECVNMVHTDMSGLVGANANFEALCYYPQYPNYQGYDYLLFLREQNLKSKCPFTVSRVLGFAHETDHSVSDIIFMYGMVDVTHTCRCSSDYLQVQMPKFSRSG